MSITVLSVDFDAWPVVQAENRFNNPPAEGWRYVMVRVRVQNVGGSVTVEQDVGDSDFSFVSSAVLYTTFGSSCGVIPDDLGASLFLGGSVEGNVCIQLPVDGSGVAMLYEPLFSFDNSDRRWFEIGQPESIQVLASVSTEVETEAGIPQGSARTNPVQAGRSLATPNGLSITVLSVDYDAWPLVQAENSFNDPPATGRRYVIVRVRVQNVGGSVTVEQNVGESDFSFVSSAVLYTTFGSSCGVIPGELDAKLFLGGSVEGNVCVQVPVGAPGVAMLYEPLFSFDNSDRGWFEIGQPEAVQILADVSTQVAIDVGVDQGSARTSPVPPGVSVITAGGLSITVLSVDYDAWPLVQAENSFNDPPATGRRYVIVRVRVQNVGGSAAAESDAAEHDFSFVSSAVLYTTFGSSCGVIPDELDAKLFLGSSVEGNVCVQLPVDGSGILMLYEPFFSFDTANRRWLGLISNAD